MITRLEKPDGNFLNNYSKYTNSSNLNKKRVNFSAHGVDFFDILLDLVHNLPFAVKEFKQLTEKYVRTTSRLCKHLKNKRSKVFLPKIVAE